MAAQRFETGYVRARTRTHTHTHIYIYIYIYIYICVCVCVWVCVRVSVYFLYIYTHTHTHTHTSESERENSGEYKLKSRGSTGCCNCHQLREMNRKNEIESRLGLFLLSFSEKAWIQFFMAFFLVTSYHWREKMFDKKKKEWIDWFIDFHTSTNFSALKLGNRFHWSFTFTFMQLFLMGFFLGGGSLARAPVKYESFLDRSIWPIHNILKGTTTPGQSRPESNGNKWVLLTFFISRTGTSQSDAV